MNHKELIASMAAKLNAPKSIVADLLDTTVTTCTELLVEEKIIGAKLEHGSREWRVKNREAGKK